MTYLITAFFILPLWGLFYWLLARFLGTGKEQNRDGTADQSQEKQPYADWLAQSLDAMFYQVPAKRLKTGVLCLVFGAAVLGFFLPATLPDVDRMEVQEAMQHNKRGEYDKALAILYRFEEQNSPLVYNEIGVAHLGQKDWDSAANAFRRALAIEPTYGKAHANLGTAYKMMENRERMQFQQSRAREMAKYPLEPDAIWGIERDYTKGLFSRIFLALALAALAWKAPRWIVLWLRKKRLAKYDEQLPDALIMAANGLRAGFSLVQTLEMVSKETTPPISQEFQLLLKEHRMGADLDEALEHMATRLPSMDTRIFVNSLLILREVGGNLTEIFDTLAETIKERKRVQAKIKTMTAEGTTQAYILSILPVVLGFIMYKLNPDTVGLLFTTSLGWVLVALMVLMEAVGLFWMLKMVKVRI